MDNKYSDMKHLFNSLSLFFVLLAIGCSSSETEEPTAEAVTLTSLDVEFQEVTQTSAKVSWTRSTASDGSTVSYNLYIDDGLIAENLSLTEYTVEELQGNTVYYVRVVAKAENAAENSVVQSDFRTLGTPPSSFPLSYRDNGCGLVHIFWDSPTVPDGSDYAYYVYINGEYEEAYSSYDTEEVGFNFLVAEGEEHTIKVVARSFSGAETAEEITFFHEACPVPADFEISVSNITGSSATLSWTPATMADGSEVYYFVAANGVSYPAPHTFTYDTDYELTYLERDTTYEVVIQAKAVDNNKTKESTVTFTTTSEYPEHPTISVIEATLYAPGSAFFGGQLNVEFSESLNNFDIGKWVAAGFEIQNYTFNPTSISSNVLSTEMYNTLADAKTGYVWIEENGTVYQLDYTVTIETN